MLYLSLFFILAGLLVFFYSAFHDAGSPLILFKKEPSGNKHGKDDVIVKDISESGKGGPLDLDERIIPDELFSEGDEEHEGIHNEISRHLLSEDDSDDKVPHTDNMPEAFSPHEMDDSVAIKEKTGPNESYSFVLFEDKSSVIDYRSGFGSIDPSRKEYNNIKRIGNGRFVLDREGINFYMEKKLFRFDFHRISEIFAGKNYIAAFLSGSDAAKLFVVENETELIDLVQRKFHEYNETKQ